MYRKFVKPRKKQLFDFIHSRTSAKIFYHSCGSVYDLVPDFIEEGVDILNPLQRSAATQKRISDGCLGEIEDVVKETIDVLAPGGGFVFFPSHNIQADVSPDRIDCVFQAPMRHTWQGVAEALGKPCPRLVHFPTDLLVKVAPNKASWCGVNFQHNNIFYNDAAERDLGFTVTIHWVDGMRRSVKWLDDHGGKCPLGKPRPGMIGLSMPGTDSAWG